jgi:hypothetical protein
MAGTLQTVHLPRDMILKNYEQEDSGDVANSFRWQVLLAILNDELHVTHEAHGVKYTIDNLETFLLKWWPSMD